MGEHLLCQRLNRKEITVMIASKHDCTTLIGYRHEIGLEWMTFPDLVICSGKETSAS
jgi:hypothetical protein